MYRSRTWMSMFLLLLCAGCVTIAPPSEQRPEHSATGAATAKTPGTGTTPAAKPTEAENTAPAAPAEESNPPPSVAVASPAPEHATPPPPEELAVLVVKSGALITQVNGDPKIRCTRPDCRIPLPPGTHRFTVGYRDTETRAGSTVTYASMYPRVIELKLEPGHQYSVTAAGRYSQKWWVEVEDQTANKTVYDDRQKPQ
jgi:hypothetical protein